MGDLKAYPRNLYKEYGRDKNISFHHMSRNSNHYGISQLTINLFLKNFIVPSYVKGEVLHTVTIEEINRLDNISWRYYRTPELWWFIALINNIDPFLLKDGQTLRILPLEYIELNIFRYTDEE